MCAIQAPCGFLGLPGMTTWYVALLICFIIIFRIHSIQRKECKHNIHEHTKKAASDQLNLVLIIFYLTHYLFNQYTNYIMYIHTCFHKEC